MISFRGEVMRMNPSVSKKEPNIYKQIILFALPMMATSVLQLLFNTADTVVVGRWGGDTPEACEAALAAVGSCGSLINLIVGLFLGLSVGADVTFAQNVGSGNREALHRTVHTAVLLSSCLGVTIGAFGFLFSGTFLSWMGTDPAAIDQATLYMKAYFCGIPAGMIYNFCAAMLRSTGDTTRPLVFLSIGGILNVFLNLLMVLVFRLGAMGVGIATAASNWVSCVLILVYMIRTDGVCHLDPGSLRFHAPTLGKILAIGLPAGIQSFVFSASNVLIQTSVNSFNSTTFVAGNTAASNLEGYVYMAQNVFYHAALTYAGQNFGAGNIPRIKKLAIACSLLVSGVGISLGSLFYLLRVPLLSIYVPGNTEAIAVGGIRMLWLVVPYFLCGLMEVSCGLIRGMGRSIPSMISSIIGSCLMRIVWILTVFQMVHTPEILYAVYPISWILTAVAQFLIFGILYRRDLKRYHKNEFVTG